MKIAFARDWLQAPAISEQVTAAIERAAALFGELGAEVEEVTLPAFELFNACGRIIMAAESFAIHEQDLRARPLDYGRYTYQRIVPGATLSAADLTNAFRLRRELATEVDRRIFSRFHALIAPVCLAPPARFSDFPLDWPPPPAATATQTIAFNVTGNPALALPIGFTPDGLPIGMQLVGRAFDEPTLLRIGAAFEAAARRLDRRPVLPDPPDQTRGS